MRSGGATFVSRVVARIAYGIRQTAIELDTLFRSGIILMRPGKEVVMNRLCVLLLIAAVFFDCASAA